MSTLTSVFDSSRGFRSHRLPVVILIFISFWSFFYNNGAIDMDSMEARNLVTAREIIEHNNWLIPTMNGEIRLAKPPLPTWFAALVSKAAGGTDRLDLLRLPNALTATLLIFFCYGLSCTLSRDRRLAFMCAAILATNFLLMKMGQRATWDIFCHSFMLGAIWAFVDGLRNNRGWLLFLASGILMGLSFMSKGPVSFFSLLLPFVGSYLAIFRFAEVANKGRLIALAFVVCIVISGFWPLYIWEFHPEALLATTQTETDAWANRHVQPFWHYVDFLIFSGAWMVFALAALIKPFAEKRIESIKEYRFLLLWLVLQLLLLSLVPEKKTRYLLPAMIPLSMLAGMLFHGMVDRFQRGIQNSKDLLALALHTGLVSLISIIFPLVLFYRLDEIGKPASTLYQISAGAAFLIVVAASWFLFARKKLASLFILTVVQVCFVSFFYMNSYRDVGISNPEYRRMTQLDPALLPVGSQVYLMENRAGIQYVWDLKRRVHRWHPQEVMPLLQNGDTIAVISSGDPSARLAQSFGRPLRVTTIGRFDYNENRAVTKKIFLSLVSLEN